MTSTADPDTTPDYALVLELAGASVAMSEQDFAAYATKRLRAIIANGDEAYLTDVITLAATMTGGVIQSWAEDTNRKPEDIFGLIRREFNTLTGE